MRLELCQSYCAVQCLVLERSEPIGASHELWVCHFGWDGQGWMDGNLVEWCWELPQSISGMLRVCLPPLPPASAKQPAQMLMWLGKVV